MRDSVFCFGPFEIDVIVIKNGSYDDMTSSRLFFSPSQQSFSEWIRRGGCLFSKVTLWKIQCLCGCLFSRVVLWKIQCFFFRIFVLVLAPLRSMLLWARMAALMINMIFCVFFSRHCSRIWASECVVVDAFVVVSWFWWIIYLLYCIVCMQDDHEWRKFWDSCKSRAAR